MPEKNPDQSDLLEARRAVVEAQRANAAIDAKIASLQESSAEIKTIVNENGYLERFRAVLRGA